MILPLNITPGYVPVICAADPDDAHLVFVPPDWEITEPYICTLCQKRAQRRIENATEPWVGRVSHGASAKGANDG